MRAAAICRVAAAGIERNAKPVPERGIGSDYYDEEPQAGDVIGGVLCQADRVTSAGTGQFVAIFRAQGARSSVPT